jgi:phosphoribosylanthranilate isomerase
MLIKICGLTRMEDIDLLSELGVHAVGFVLWPESPRALTLARARSLARALPPFVTTVGVLVDPTSTEIQEVADAGLQVAQIHGTVPPVARERAPLRILRTASLATGDSLIDADLPEGETVLLDAHDPLRRGGTGQTIDWVRAARVAQQRPVILAGGLSPDNVADAIRQVRPRGVDVSSGVERSPGIKDHARLAAFVRAVRSAI